MSSVWSNNDFSLSALDALQSGLMVELIATPRSDLKTCRATDLVSEAVSVNKEDQFDYLPVLSGASTNRDTIVGMFHDAEYRTGIWDGSVEKHMEVLSERHLIGSDTSIVNFISDADSRPSRLVVSGEGFSGLVTLSDLQKLPVRAALFAAVTSFEMTMSQAIRHRFSGKTEWKELLNERRRQKIQEEIEQSKRGQMAWQTNCSSLSSATRAPSF
jgi:predicted transcriptional regulator